MKLLIMQFLLPSVASCHLIKYIFCSSLVSEIFNVQIVVLWIVTPYGLIVCVAGARK
jgi:hypothetical protein